MRGPNKIISALLLARAGKGPVRTRTKNSVWCLQKN